ncbi:MAG TPA: hypothetical protein VN241_15695 [Microbacterium sp.]|nr:hypothetical protein [Microbacterium sp.]
MNRRIAALAIAAVAVLGITGCSGSPGASNTAPPDAETSAPAESQSDGQSVADACASAGAKVQEATTTLTDLDVSAAASDPEGTIAAFTRAADALGAAAESVSNAEVRDAVVAVHEDFGAMRDLLSRMLLEQDASAITQLAATASEIQDSAATVASLCGG